MPYAAKLIKHIRVRIYENAYLVLRQSFSKFEAAETMWLGTELT